jgi:hypothetical protein
VDLGNVSVEDTSQLIYRITGGSYNPGTDLNISPGETLSGTGTVEVNLTNAGTVSPGSSPSMLTIAGNYLQEPAGTLAIELGGTVPNTEYDQLIVNGTAALDGKLDIQLLEPFTPELGDAFTLMIYGSHSGDFSQVSLPELAAGLGWKLEYGTTELILSVGDATGSISGTISYVGDEGFNPLDVGLFVDPIDPPVQTLNVNSATGQYDYAFIDLLDGNYYIGALMDLNGNHQPDPDEPFAWLDINQDNEPDMLILQPGEQLVEINFTLDDPEINLFLPLVLR